MSSLKTIKNRRASVASTKKITKAMQLISANKLNKAQQRFVAHLDVLDALSSTAHYAMGHLLDVGKLDECQFVKTLQDACNLEQLDQQNGCINVIIASDRGLCGGFNNAVIKIARQNIKAGDYNILLGSKLKVLVCESVMESSSYSNLFSLAQRASDVASELIKNLYSTTCYIYYNSFQNAVSYKTLKKKIWPIQVSYVDDHEFEQIDAYKILREYILHCIFDALLSNAASENAARMIAMDNATKNASKMIDKLSLLFNRTRQAIITKELIEIISGAEAL